MKTILRNGTPRPRKPRVYVLDCIPDRLDIRTAARHGELWALESFAYNIWQDEYAQDIIDAMEESGYNPSADYFLVAGHMANVVMCAATLVARYRRVNLLIYNKQTDGYEARTIRQIETQTSGV